MDDNAELINKIIEFEEVNGMYDKKIQGVYLWDDVLRTQIYFMLRTHFFNTVDQMVYGENMRTRIGVNPMLFYDRWVRRNIYFPHGKRDVLIIQGNRKNFVDDKYYRDELTYWIDKHLERSHYVWERSYNGNGYVREESKNIIQMDLDKFKKRRLWNSPELYGRHRFVFVDEFEEQIIKPVESFFSIHFSLIEKRRLLSNVNYRIENHDVFVLYWKFILNKIRPKVILFVDARSTTLFQAMISIAKEKRIPMVELPHGFSGPNNISTNYSLTDDRICRMPDYFLTYGEREKDLCRFPIDKDRIQAVGNIGLEMAQEEYQEGTNIILIIGSNKKRIYDFTRDLSKLLSDTKYTIVLKLHPNESGYAGRLREEYFANSENVEVIGDAINHIYYYLGRASWVVGSQTTVLLEATRFDTQIAILDRKENEDELLLKLNLAVPIDSAQEFIEVAGIHKVHRSVADSLYKPNGIDNINLLVDNIIKEWY